MIEGGVRIKGITATDVHASANVLTVDVTEPGDFSRYILRLVQSGDSALAPEGFDPRLSQIDFSFRATCPSDFDCQAAALPPPQVPAAPELSYLAKDYASFRQLMLDRLSALMPGWNERNPADLQVALVELLAYVGDSLSYYQDAVATEAYLGTARKRVSVRRHARLLDYCVHEGSNARAWVCIEIDAGSVADGAILPQGTQLLTRGPDPEVFESMHAVTLRASHNSIPLYTWGEECGLPAGATKATLRDRMLSLKKRDVLIFEGGEQPWAVRLTDVKSAIDPLNGTPLVEISWDESDALPFDLVNLETTVAHGNVVLADHGATVEGEPLPRVPEGGRYRPTLGRRALTFQAPFDSDASATATMRMTLTVRVR